MDELNYLKQLVREYFDILEPDYSEMSSEEFQLVMLRHDEIEKEIKELVRDGD